MWRKNNPDLSACFCWARYTMFFHRRCIFKGLFFWIVIVCSFRWAISWKMTIRNHLRKNPVGKWWLYFLGGNKFQNTTQGVLWRVAFGRRLYSCNPLKKERWTWNYLQMCEGNNTWNPSPKGLEKFVERKSHWPIDWLRFVSLRMLGKSDPNISSQMSFFHGDESQGNPQKITKKDNPSIHGS